MREKAGLGEGFLNFFFPLHCVSCGEYIRVSAGYPLCGQCQGKIAYLRSPICGLCGRALQSPKITRCRICRTARYHFDLARSVAYYTTPVRECLHAWKYQKLTSLGKLFCALLEDYLTENPCLLDVDWMLPVPLHTVRFRERGFNQSDVLAGKMGKVFKRPVFMNAVRRTRNTRPQPGLKPQERRRNLRGAFTVVREELIRDKRILIIDDVMTSRSTIDTLARELRRSGASQVYALTIASGKPQDDPVRGDGVASGSP